MEASFWHRKWEKGEIAFHEGEANRFLTEHFGKLHLAQGARIFLPLCGKTRDIAWLLSRGCRVKGAELSALAVKELFEDLGLVPDVSGVGALTLYRAENIDIFVGDIFDVSAEVLGHVDAIYDRAALVALPLEMRKRYAAHLVEISHAAPQLLITYEYDQQQMAGPPFSVSADEVGRHYASGYHLQAIETRAVTGGLKGKVASTETAWVLRKAAE